MAVISTRSAADRRDDAAWAIEELRRAESHLARRRQTRCGPGDTERAALRYVLEAADADRELTPSELARLLHIETSSTTAILRRLEDGGAIVLRPHPTDRRRKVVLPVNRNDDPEAVDPLTRRIRELAADLSEQEAELVVGFLARVTAAVEEECPD